jgi:hypothetical protein
MQKFWFHWFGAGFRLSNVFSSYIYVTILLKWSLVCALCICQEQVLAPIIHIHCLPKLTFPQERM